MPEQERFKISDISFMRLPVIRMKKKKIRIKKLIRRKLRKRTEMATWHFESHFQKQSISECLRRDKASTEAVIQTLAILPDWQKFKDLYMSDGGIAHLTSMIL